MIYPKELIEFVAQNCEQFPELLDSEWLKLLGNIRIRGRHPRGMDTWLLLFLKLRKVLCPVRQK